MHCTRKVTEDIIWIGGSDRRLALFENIFPIPRGVSYNSYLLKDEKTVLLDTVDRSIAGQFLENLAFALDGRNLDYMIVNHMEPDHCALIEEIVRQYPEVKVVGNAKTFGMIQQFYTFDIAERSVTVKEGETLNTGKHTLHFVMAPMVHWPEVMVTYDETDKVLFSADAFGTFGALNGNIFNDEIDFDRDWLDDARRYYTNIVGKYGGPVQTTLKKAAGLDISIICPLHGPVLTENLGHYIGLYDTWSSYRPEEEGVVIAYTSVYGHTKKAVELLAEKLKANGAPKVVVYDLARDDMSAAVADAFRYSRLVLATITYNGSIYPFMNDFVTRLVEHNFQNRTVGLIENGSWAPTAARVIKKMMEGSKNIKWTDTTVTIMSAVKQENVEQIEAMAKELC